MSSISTLQDGLKLDFNGCVNLAVDELSLMAKLAGEDKDSRDDVLSRIFPIIRDLGFEVLYRGGEEYSLYRERPEIMAIRKEFEDLGWILFCEQRAYMFELLAFRYVFGFKQMLPRFTGDIGFPDEVQDNKLEALRNLLEQAKEATLQPDDQNCPGGKAPRREIGETLYCTEKLPWNQRITLVEVLEDVTEKDDGRTKLRVLLIPKNRTPIEEADPCSWKNGTKYPGGHDQLNIWAWQTATEQEIRKEQYTGLSLGEIAYDAYCSERGWVAFNGDPLPTFKDMAADPAKQDIAAAWEKAGQAVISAR